MGNTRPATQMDLEQIRYVAKQTWSLTYNGIIPEKIQEKLLDTWYSLDQLKRVLEQENTRLYVFEARSEIVGFAQFVIRRDGLGQLARIYVLPAYQGMGVGKAILYKGLMFLKERGVRELRVVVERKNTIGKRFYEGVGFHWLRDLEDEIGDRDFGVFTLDLSEYMLSLTNDLL